MKILLSSPLPPPVGGIASWTENLLDYYSNNGNKWEIIHQNTAIKYRQITNSNFWNRLIGGIQDSCAIIKDFKNNLDTIQPDLIHLTSSASLALIKDILLIHLASKRKIPVIIHFRLGRIPKVVLSNNWEKKLLWKVIQGSRKVIVIDQKSFTTLIGSGFKNIVNIPNPIGLDVEQKVAVQKGLIKVKNLDRLIYVGHIIKDKGVYELVEACSQLHAVKELLLIGPYEEGMKNDLLNIANKRGNGKWLILTGPIDKNQVLNYMLESQILALPSYTEGFPNVVIEAMAMGCTIIATDVGAIPEMIDSEGNSPCGICVSVKNVEKLKEGILDLLTDTAKTELMGKRGIERVLNYYTMERIVEQYISVWELALQGDLLIK